MLNGFVRANTERSRKSGVNSGTMYRRVVTNWFTIFGVLVLVHFAVMLSQDSIGRSRRAQGKAASSNDLTEEHYAATVRPNVFITPNSSRVVSQRGGLALLPCAVKSKSQGTVSWIRRRDYQLLTVGLATYSSDERFMVEHVRHLGNWGLQIKSVQDEDAGIYECQVSTHPPISIFVNLIVREAVAEILGAPDLHIRAGSTLRLVCSIRGATEVPLYVFWYHETRMVNYDVDQGILVTGERGASVLTVPEANKTLHSGNYTCAPSNARPNSITVHVLNGEKPAAMQHANRSSSAIYRRPSNMWGVIIILPTVLIIKSR